MTDRKGHAEANRGAVIVVPPGEGKAVQRRFGEETVIKVSAAETRDAYAVRENAVPAGFARVPFHIHHVAEEAFYILEGEMTVFTPKGARVAPAGSLVLIPRGTVHSLANRGATPLRWLTLISPGWISGWIEEESELLQDTGTSELDPARQAAIHEKYGLEIIGPSPADGARSLSPTDRHDGNRS